MSRGNNDCIERLDSISSLNSKIAIHSVKGTQVFTVCSLLMASHVAVCTFHTFPSFVTCFTSVS